MVLAVLQGNVGSGFGDEMRDKVNKIHDMVTGLSSADGASTYTGKTTTFKSCLEIYKNGTRKDGYYFIAPRGEFEVPSEVR